MFNFKFYRSTKIKLKSQSYLLASKYKYTIYKAWFPYMVVTVVKRVTISLNGQFIIVYTCKPHINHKYSLVLITPRIFSSQMLYFG